MKALEILENLKEYIETESRVGDLDYSHYSVMIDYVSESIEELKALENRSCDNCKFKYVVDSMTTECQHNDSPIDYVDLDCFPTFSCNVWESK